MESYTKIEPSHNETVLSPVLQTISRIVKITSEQVDIPFEKLSIVDNLVIIGGGDGVGKTTFIELLSKDLSGNGYGINVKKANKGRGDVDHRKLLDLADDFSKEGTRRSLAFAILSSGSFEPSLNTSRSQIDIFDRGDERYYAWGITEVYRALLSSPYNTQIMSFINSSDLASWDAISQAKLLDEASPQIEKYIYPFLDKMNSLVKRTSLLRRGILTAGLAPKVRIQIKAKPETIWKRLVDRGLKCDYDPDNINDVIAQNLIQDLADQQVTARPFKPDMSQVLVTIHNDGDLNLTAELSKEAGSIVRYAQLGYVEGMKNISKDLPIEVTEISTDRNNKINYRTLR